MWSPRCHWEYHTVKFGRKNQDSETSKQFPPSPSFICPGIHFDNRFEILASLEKKKHENLVLLRLHSVFSEICINKNVPERLSDVSGPNGQKNLDVIILNWALLISPAVLGLNPFRRTSQHTSHFAILSSIFLSLNIRLGSCFNCLRKYRIRAYVADFLHLLQCNSNMWSYGNSIHHIPLLTLW